MRLPLPSLAGLAAALVLPALAQAAELGPRPAWLVAQMSDGALKERLEACIGEPAKRTLFSISHRGAPLQFPEHTEEGYRAAALMGAGILECDVTFTRDKELVCRHSQNDLHQTTNILATDLAAKCTLPFSPAADGTPAKAECRTSDLTLAEFQSLDGRMDSANKAATTPADYIGGIAPFRTNLYGASGTLMTLRDSIALFEALGVKHTPELKTPSVAMPFDGFSQEDYAQALIDAYREAGVAPENVYPQSFSLEDVLYWIEHEPEFGRQAVYLDGRRGADPASPEALSPTMAELKAMGVNYLAPPLYLMLAVHDGRLIPSAYARAAKAAGLELIAWTIERSGPLAGGGGWYYQGLDEVIDGDGRMFEVIDVLAREVGVAGIFSDWPATTSFYASCMGLD